MRILEVLESIGYEIELREGKIKLSFQGEGQPDKEKVVPLLQEIRNQKSELVEFLKRQRSENNHRPEATCHHCPASSFWESPSGERLHCFSYALFPPVTGGKPTLCEEAIKNCEHKDNTELLRKKYYRH